MVLIMDVDGWQKRYSLLLKGCLEKCISKKISKHGKGNTPESIIV